MTLKSIQTEIGSNRFEYWEKSIAPLLRHPQTQQFDFIYAAGLYNYRKKRTAQLLTA